MANFWGRDWTRRELESRADLSQIAGWTRATRRDGLENEVEHFELRTGAGLRVSICPSRGLDVVEAEFRGVNLAWRHPNGAIHPAFYGADNFDWLRGAPCGLLTTCGLGSFGPSCEENGEKYGIHDRFSYLPAREIGAQTLWRDEKTCEFQLNGMIRQTRLFGANFSVRRTFSARLGENFLRMRDEIRNDGFERAPCVVLYHCNFGWPLLDEGARVVLNAQKTMARDADAAQGIANWAQIEAPQQGFREQVFFHDLARDERGWSAATLWNENFHWGVKLRFNAAQLPFFTQWKMTGAGAYVLGLEPSNAPLASRAQLRERSELPLWEPGETRVFEMEWQIIEKL